MKKFSMYIIVVFICATFSVSISAASPPALPPFVSPNGSLNVFPNSSNQAVNNFIGNCYISGGSQTTAYPYIVLASNSFGLGFNDGTNINETSGKYAYLHFVRGSSTNSTFYFYKPSNDSVASVGLDSGYYSPYDILTFTYDRTSGTFDDGVIRNSGRGILFDYVVDSSPLNDPTTTYPNYGKIGSKPLTPANPYPGYNYFLKIKSTAVKSYLLKVNYVYEDGKTAAATSARSLASGVSYSVDSPSIGGYIPDQYNVSGTMGVSDVTVTVTYKKSVHPNKRFLTIRYVYTDGTTAAPSYSSYYYPAYVYRVDSPKISGAYPDRYNVSGYMPNSDHEEIVTYRREAIPENPYHQLFIEYVDTDGNSLFPPVRSLYLAGASYSVRSPLKQGYKCTLELVEGVISGDATHRVIYIKSDNENDWGGNDDADSSSSGGGSSGGSSSGGSGGSSSDGGSSSSGDVSSGGSSSGGGDGSSSGGSGGSSGGSGGSSSGGNSSGGSSGGSGSSGNSSSGGGSGGGTSSGDNSSGDSSSGGNTGGCNCDKYPCSNGCPGNSTTCGCSHVWNPGTVDFDDLIPPASVPEYGDFPSMDLFDPFDYNNYTPPASSEYDPLQGFSAPSNMPELPTPSVPDNNYNPFNPSVPSNGDNPFNPSVPSNGDNPFNPSVPSNSDNPFNPSVPINGDNPFNPSVPSNGDNPFNPSVPSNSDNPFNPSVPSNSDNPFNPSVPSNSYNPFLWLRSLFLNWGV